MNRAPLGAALLGLSLIAGLAALGWLLGDAAMRVKALERVVSVKGLSEREVAADTAIWTLRFQDAGNDLPALSTSIQAKNTLIAEFLARHGLAPADITRNPPAITDLQAQSYGSPGHTQFRYTGLASVTVYSRDIAAVRKALADVVHLAQQGVAITGADYGSSAEFLFTGLNELKPAMIEEATQNARSVAEKFAADSRSRLGAIKSASQGQFTIEDRDASNPHIKKVRVVSTVEYYLSD